MSYLTEIWASRHGILVQPFSYGRLLNTPLMRGHGDSDHSPVQSIHDDRRSPLTLSSINHYQLMSQSAQRARAWEFLVLVIMMSSADPEPHIRLSSLAKILRSHMAKDHDCNGTPGHHRDSDGHSLPQWPRASISWCCVGIRQIQGPLWIFGLRAFIFNVFNYNFNVLNY